MDSNGQRFWMWSRPGDWRGLDGCVMAPPPHDAATPRLALAPERPAPPVRPGVERALAAETELARLPVLRDRLGTHARWDVSTNTLMGYGAFDGEVPRYATSASGAPLDMALDADDVLLLGFADRIELVDLRERFAPVRLALPVVDGGGPFQPQAIACDAQGGRWALDRVQRRVACIAGTPWPERGEVVYDPGTFRPSPENPDAPRVELLPTALPATLRPVALAASAGGRLAVAGWGGDGALTLLLLDAAGAATAEVPLDGAAYAHALAWIDEATVALRVADLGEALAYAPDAFRADDADGALQPLGRRYPSADAAPGRFVAATPRGGQPPWLPLPPSSGEAATLADAAGLRHSRPLVPLAWRAVVGEGRARGRAIDSGELDTVWHRLCVEAVIPPGCGVVVELAADDEPDVPGAWFPHWFGDAAAMPASLPADTPRAAWLSTATELPHRAGLLGCAPQRQRAGLFSVLVQRAGRQRRDLRGRRLWLRLTLMGHGGATPEIAAVRAWGQRFSPLRQYLPELYRDEAVYDREATGHATPHDFLARYSELFEGVLTPIEDAIADARVLTDPAATPEGWLDWLAAWTGERFPARLPRERRRDWLRRAPDLRRLRGSVDGLALALDIATAGAVSAGRVIVFEDFRLRRTLATLLGIELGRDDDPLLPGLVVSGNSYVGDTLILGDAAEDGGLTETQREFLALFGLGTDAAADQATLATVYERTAHRATVLVHEGLDEDLQALIASVAAELAPAHVLLAVRAVREPFLVGIASLVGIDSYLRAAEPPRTARIARSDIGRGDRLQGGGAFDWRLEDGVPGAWSDSVPTAVLSAPAEVSPGQPVPLDGSASVPPAAGAIARWRYTRLP